jgi:hypothetical protein
MWITTPTQAMRVVKIVVGFTLLAAGGAMLCFRPRPCHDRHGPGGLGAQVKLKLRWKMKYVFTEEFLAKLGAEQKTLPAPTVTAPPEQKTPAPKVTEPPSSASTMLTPPTPPFGSGREPAVLNRADG